MFDHKDYDRRRYLKNKAKIRAKNDTYTEAIKTWLFEYKGRLKCEKCDFSNPRALQFHHRNPSTKEINVSDAVRHSWSHKRILKEIEKCDVLCANCHAIKTYQGVGKFG